MDDDGRKAMAAVCEFVHKRRLYAPNPTKPSPRDSGGNASYTVARPPPSRKNIEGENANVELPCPFFVVSTLDAGDGLCTASNSPVRS